MKKLKTPLKALIKSALTIASIMAILPATAILYESYMYNYKGQSVIKLYKKGSGGGTGFQIMAPNGVQYTLTNAHICHIDDELTAEDHSGEEIGTLRVLKIYPEHDLCIMEGVPALPALKLADSIQARERVWLIGYPALRPLTLESGHFAGIMNIRVFTQCEEYGTKKMNINGKDAIVKYRALIPCIRPYKSQYINNISYGGNSGSPVLDKWGNVVGVLFAGRRDQPTSSFTVPHSAIKAFLDEYAGK